MPSPQQYDPTSAQPYQAVPAPEIQPAMPSPIPTQAPQANGAVKTSGAIATGIDGILRGVMAGRAFAQAKQVMQQKKKSDDLYNSYNQDAQRLLELHQSGVDTNSQEYQQAKSAVDGSWGALQQFRGEQILAQQPKKGRGKKQAEASDPSTLMARLHSNDPHEKVQALYELSQKAGPPVYGQVAAYNAPRAQQARATADAQGEAAQSSANTQNAMAKMAEQITNLSVKPNLTSDEKTQLESLKNKYTDLRDTLNPPKTPAGGTHRYSDDGKEEYEVDVEGREVPGTRRPRSIVQAAGPKVGTFGAFMKAGYGEDPSVEDYEQGRALWAKSGAGTTVGTHQIAVAQPDGSTRLVTVESTSTKTFPGAGPQAPNSPATPPRQQSPGRTAPGGPPRAGGGAPGPVVGGHVVTQFSQVEKDTHEAYQKAKDKYNAAITYIDDQVSNPKTKAAWPPTRVSMERKKAADALEQENKGIAALNSARTRDLGGIPGDDQQHPAAAAHEPESTHGSDSNSNFVTQSLQGKKVKGMLSPGNVDITNRPNIQNPDGTHSSTYSMSSEFDGKEVLYPGVGDGTTYPARQLTQKEAADQYRKTGKNFGTFKDAASATAYGHTLHEDQQKFGNKASSPQPPPGATAPVYGEDGHTLIGYVVDGGFQALKK